MNEPLIQVKQLNKTFRTFQRREGIAGAVYNLFHRDYQNIHAVDNISFTIQSGEFVGYIGPNGAGKSTTIKMLTGILAPTSGEIRVEGLIPWKQRRKYVTKIGVVFGQRTQLWWDLAVIESFNLLAKIYQVPKKEYKERLSIYTELLELQEFLHIPVRKLSLGQRMRCDLTAALLHNPSLLFLDEPSIGLDVLAKARIQEFLQYLNQEHKTTILLTTHDLDEIEKLCPRIILIDHGKKVYDGQLDTMLDACVRTQKITLDLKIPSSLEPLNEYKSKGLVSWTLVNPYQAEIIIERKHMSAADAITVLFSKLPVKDVQVQEASTEEVIREFYEGKITLPGQTV